MTGLPKLKPLVRPNADIGDKRAKAQIAQNQASEGFKGGSADTITVPTPAGTSDSQSQAALVKNAETLLNIEEQSKYDAAGGSKRHTKRKALRRRRRRNTKHKSSRRTKRRTKYRTKRKSSLARKRKRKRRYRSHKRGGAQKWPCCS